MLEIVSQSDHAYQLSEFRDHCRIPWTDDDPAIQRSLDAAVLSWERMTNHYIRATTIDCNLRPGEMIPFGPDPTLVSVTQTDLDTDAETTVTSQWAVRRQWGSAVMTLRSDGDWFPAEYAYTFRLSTTGSTDAMIKAAIFGIGEHFFQHRGVVDPGTVTQIPYTVRAILSNYQKGSA